MVFQDLEDRAVVRRPAGCARRSQPLQRALHPLEITDPLLDDLNLLSGFPLDGIACTVSSRRRRLHSSAHIEGGAGRNPLPGAAATLSTP